jgi:hypothetical protein
MNLYVGCRELEKNMNKIHGQENAPLLIKNSCECTLAVIYFCEKSGKLTKYFDY